MKRERAVMKLVAVVIFSITTAYSAFSQDIHFTQIFNNPSTLNPALTGFSDSQMRFYLTHRNQWGAVSVPFSTYNATFDIQLIKRKQQGDVLGLGISAFSDKAGDSKFGTQNINASLSYIKALGNSNRNLIGFGIKLAYVQRSLDYHALYFDNQYNGSYFDPKLSTGEKFAVNNYSYTDISAGFNWFTNISYDFKLQTGVSVWHLNRPNQSLKDDNTVKLSVKGIVYSEAEITLSPPYRLLPAIYIQQQGSFTEIMPAVRFKYIINKKQRDYSAFLFGMMYRNRDAIALYTGFDFKAMNIGVSYDFNISSLKVASNYMGGIEINFSWKLSREHHPKPKDLPCPIF